MSNLIWRKSTYSSPLGEDCVEVACTPAEIAIRDSKNPDRGILLLGPADWRTFTDAVKTGRYDLQASS
jgi:hypothetical protein